ncbi:MAG: virulence RhuM family protein [Draconibacterium sp.]|nr:virulence RhuM family protein [Draconibacterium sp.]
MKNDSKKLIRNSTAEFLIFTCQSGEIEENRTIRNFRIVQTEGKRKVSRDVDFYNLDAIISVGYRVNSVRATQSRQWATKVLQEKLQPK